MSNNRLKSINKTILLLIAVCFLSVACGKKGPLYISTKDADIINKHQTETPKQAVEKEAVSDPAKTPAENAK